MKTEKIIVKEYVYEKVLKEHNEIEIPLESLFYQEHNYRSIIGVFPQFFDGKVFELKIVKITDRYILNNFIRTDERNMRNILVRIGNKEVKNLNESFIEKVIWTLKNKFYEDSIITKEKFLEYYNKHLLKLTDIFEDVDNFL